MERWLLDLLRCPLHPEAGSLDPAGSTGLVCPSCGTTYRVADGIPSLLAPSREPESVRDRECRRWDEQAARYDATRAGEQVYRATVAAAVRTLAPRDGDLVLDAGCGTGLTLPGYARPSLRVVALDLSRESLLRARDRAAGLPVAFVQGDLTALPLAPAAFDRVLCANVLQNLPGEDLRSACVQELARVTRLGGRVVVSAHNFSARKRRLGWHKERTVAPAGQVPYIHRFDAAELRGLLGSVLAVRTVRGAGFPLPYRWKLSWASRLLERALERLDAGADWGHLLVATCVKEGSSTGKAHGLQPVGFAGPSQ